MKEVDLLHKGAEITHISWSTNGQVLIIADTLGRVSTLVSQISLNSNYTVTMVAQQTDDNLMAIVGLTWLASEKQVRNPSD